jgi:hypothetical protein
LLPLGKKLKKVRRRPIKKKVCEADVRGQGLG